jgi:hypothetical protein
LSAGDPDEKLVRKIGDYLTRWYKDELKTNKSWIVDQGHIFYIEDPFEREQTMEALNSFIESPPDWKIKLARYWTQDNDNDCGLYTLLAIIIHFVGIGRETLPDDNEKACEAVSSFRSMLLNFFCFKYMTKSNEDLDPFVAIDLLY